MAHRLRTIDLALPAALAVAAALALLPDPPHDVQTPVPVRGTIADPCTGEELVFGGTAEVRLSATPSGTGGYAILASAELSGATATSQTGNSYELGGLVTGNGEAAAPFPVTVEVEANGLVLGGGPLGNFGVRMRLPLSVEETGGIAPTGAAEVVLLECKAREPVDRRPPPPKAQPVNLTR